MSNIELLNPEGTKKFLSGISVFRIIANSVNENGEVTVTEKGIATTVQDYERLLSEHEYISILHLAPLTYKIAYLYGCLNFEKGVPRKETFTFWYREIKSQKWTEWFVVKPYKD